MGRLEYITKRKSEGELLFKRSALATGYILLFILLAAVILALSPQILIIPFFLLDIALCLITVFATKWYFCIEDELVFASGELILTSIYGRSIRKKKLSVELNSLTEVGIYDDRAYEHLSQMSLQKNYFAVSSMAAEVIYYAIFDEGEDRCVLYFEADERAISMIKQSNFGALRAGNIK